MEASSAGAGTMLSLEERRVGVSGISTEVVDFFVMAEFVNWWWAMYRKEADRESKDRRGQERIIIIIMIVVVVVELLAVTSLFVSDISLFVDNAT